MKRRISALASSFALIISLFPERECPGDSRVFSFDGNYGEYEEDKKKRLGAEAAQLTR